MKLTNLLTKIILEEVGTTIPVTKFVTDGYLITLNASKHQWKDRQGSKSLEDIVEIYEDNFLNNPKFYDRVGVPNRLIKNVFINDFYIIKKRMSNLNNPKNSVIKFTSIHEFY